MLGGAGLLAGLAIHRPGNPGEMSLRVNSIRFQSGQFEPKNDPAMPLAALLCFASGGSAGPEAPLVQVAGSAGAWLARKLRIWGEALRIRSSAGMAAGFTALFGAPPGGALFALETLPPWRLSEYFQALIPALVASCASFGAFILITPLASGPPGTSRWPAPRTAAAPLRPWAGCLSSWCE